MYYIWDAPQYCERVLSGVQVFVGRDTSSNPNFGPMHSDQIEQEGQSLYIRQ